MVWRSVRKMVRHNKIVLRKLSRKARRRHYMVIKVLWNICGQTRCTEKQAFAALYTHSLLFSKYTQKSSTTMQRIELLSIHHDSSCGKTDIQPVLLFHSCLSATTKCCLTSVKYYYMEYFTLHKYEESESSFLPLLLWYTFSFLKKGVSVPFSIFNQYHALFLAQHFLTSLSHFAVCSNGGVDFAIKEKGHIKSYWRS